jgi:uncharacterized membrane protein
MDIYVIVLRIIHITSGVFWAGAAFFNAWLLSPAVDDSGQEGSKVMGALMRRGFVLILTVAAVVTILAGLLLYANKSDGFQVSWITSAGGLVLTLGVLCGLAGGSIGASMVGASASKMGELGAAIAQSGGKPSAEQGAQMAALKNRIAIGGRLNAALLLITVLCMAIGPELLPG